MSAVPPVRLGVIEACRLTADGKLEATVQLNEEGLRRLREQLAAAPPGRVDVIPPGAHQLAPARHRSGRFLCPYCREVASYLRDDVLEHMGRCEKRGAR